jgi:hypothetical protein
LGIVSLGSEPNFYLYVNLLLQIVREFIKRWLQKQQTEHLYQLLPALYAVFEMLVPLTQSLQPVIGFPTVWCVDLDACQLKRAFALPLGTALERVHTEPETEKVEPVLGSFPTLETALDPQVGLQDTVDRLGSATGSDHAFQDIQQFFC